MELNALSERAVVEAQIYKKQDGCMQVLLQAQLRRRCCCRWLLADLNCVSLVSSFGCSLQALFGFQNQRALLFE